MPDLTSRDGRRLHFRRDGEGPALLLVHGFTGASDAWDPALVEALAQHRCVLRVDLLGHGASSRCEDPKRFAMHEIVADLAEVLDANAIERALWVGYSMGGRIALGAAVLRPERVQGLVLEGASPGLHAAEEREARVRSDQALARSLESEPLAAFVDRWMALPLFASQARLGPERRAAERARRLRNAPGSLAACLRGLGTGTQPSFWDALGAVEAPVLLLAGEEDAKFRASNARMAASFPNARSRIVARSGHTTHLENPSGWLDAVERFADEVFGIGPA